MFGSMRTSVPDRQRDRQTENFKGHRVCLISWVLGLHYQQNTKNREKSKADYYQPTTQPISGVILWDLATTIGPLFKTPTKNCQDNFGMKSKITYDS